MLADQLIAWEIQNAIDANSLIRVSPFYGCMLKTSRYHGGPLQVKPCGSGR
jgi:hypothetical protein